jgi:undecaprenyl-diphosphatase
MFQKLLELDTDVFLYLNGLHSPQMDGFMWWVSQKYSWLPFYFILLAIIIYRERPVRFIYTLIFITLVIVLNDQISVLIKGLIERPRPSRNPDIADMVHVINDYRGGRYGFVSSHAANVFGAAAFLAGRFKDARWGIFLYLWAALVSYSRIYLGVHYPLDIICGGLMGIILGIQCYVYNVKTVVAVERQISIYKNKKALKERRKKARETVK